MCDIIMCACLCPAVGRSTVYSLGTCVYVSLLYRPLYTDIVTTCIAVLSSSQALLYLAAARTHGYKLYFCS